MPAPPLMAIILRRVEDIIFECEPERGVIRAAHSLDWWASFSPWQGNNEIGVQVPALVSGSRQEQLCFLGGSNTPEKQ